MTDSSIRKIIRNGDYQAFEELIQNGELDLKTETVFGSWLHYAARQGQLSMVKSLVEMGADIDLHCGVHSGTPLHYAASLGHLEVVEYLLNQGAVMDVDEPNRNPLFAAITGGHTKVAELLIRHGIVTTVRYTGEVMRDEGALEYARKWGRTDIVNLLQDPKKIQ